MNKLLLGLIVLTLVLEACSKVPVTGRRQMNLVSESTLEDMSIDAYGQFLKSHRVIKNSADSKLVLKVGNKISAAVSQYLKKHGGHKRVKGYNWQFKLVDDPQVNAWCMPGGKVVFYSGIMPFTQTELGIAVVMGHEIAHAIARHGNERMSQQLAVELGGVALSVAVSSKSEETQNTFMGAYGLGSAVGMILPFSRKHESEADKMGLIFMALAGYNPEEAVKFWSRMAKNSGGAPPEFMSTHPSHSTRIDNLKKWMPEAKQHYKR